LRTNPAGDVLESPLEITAAVAGAVITTAIAGGVFAWLRLRASSVMAPIVLHLAINSSAYLAGWLVVSNGWAS
jgi:membrane protease YdiL (CAAX protease family)